MSSKLEFAERASAKGANIAALCREFGITRQTGHKWLKRFREQGPDGLDEQSRRPKATPLATAEEVVAAIVQAREAHPRWGARKLAVVLQRKLREQAPSERTIHRVLERFGKLRKRRQRRALDVVDHAPDVKAGAPNDVWTVDFKGWWRTSDGERCEPLTVRDAFSRYVLAIQLLEGTSTKAVRPAFEKLFERHGVPKAIQCDNGSPFASVQGRAGLTALSAWWVSLGIQIVRSRPGCPQDNGAHERMHADMAGDLEASPADSRRAQQRACDRWRQQFNHVRPHDALKGRTPSDVYVNSTRRPRVRIAMYPPGWLVQTVRKSGDVRTRTGNYYVSGALVGQRIGLEPLHGLRWRAWLYDVNLGELEMAPELLPSSESWNTVAKASPRGAPKATLKQAKK